MHGAIPPIPNTPSWRGAQLKHSHDEEEEEEECVCVCVCVCVSQHLVWYCSPPNPEWSSVSYRVKQ